MAITMRNGNSSDFVPSKMRRAELSVLNDTRKVHVGMGDGTTEELVTKRVIEDAIQNTNNDIINELTTKVNVATTNANTQGTYAKTQGDYAKAQGDYAKQQGDSVRDSVAPIINTNLQASYNDKASGLSGESIVCNVADDGLVNVTKIEGRTDQLVTTQGKNVHDPMMAKNNIYQNHNATTGVFTQSSNSNYWVGYFKVENGKTYVSNYAIEGGVYYDVTMTITSGVAFLTASNPKVTPFTSTQDGYVCFNVPKSTLVYESRHLIQLELGSTATTYEPFTPNSPSVEYPSEMKYANNFEVKSVGKNLLPPTTTLTPVTNNGITFTPQSNGSISMHGTATANAEIYLWNNWSSNAPTKFILPRGTYSLNRSPNSNVELFVVSKMTVMMKSSVGVHTLPNDVNVTSCFIRVLSGTELNNVIIYPQLEQGTVATSYEPYVEDKTTISLPMGELNVIEKVNGKLYHTDNTSIFTPTSDSVKWFNAVSDSVFRIGFFMENVLEIPSIPIPIPSAKCDKFRYVVTTDFSALKNGELMINRHRDWGGTRGYISVPSSEVTTKDLLGAKEWISKNTLTIHFKRYTPIVTPLSDIYLKSYSTTTHLLSTSNPQVRMTADFKSELWSRDYSQDVLLSSTVNKNTSQDAEITKKFNKSDIVSSDTINDANKIPSSVVTNALGKEIDFLTEKTQKIYNYASGLSWYTQNMSTTEFFNAMPSFMEVTFMVNTSSPLSDLPQSIGIITIIKGVNNNHGTCEYTSSVNNAIETYVANFSYAGFSGWRKILHENNKGELLNGLYTNALLSGTDLNNLTTIGEYYSGNSDISTSLLNCPHTTSGFKMTVEYLSAPSHLLQTIKAVNGGGVYYRCGTSNNGWIFGNWVSVFGRERGVTMNTTHLTHLYTSAEYNPLQSKVGKTVHLNGNFNVHTVVPTTDSSAPTTILSGLYGAYRHRWVPITRMQNGAIYWMYLTASSSDTGSILRSSTELPLGNYYIDISYIAN